jgi:amino acid adenylation domain-containing protein
MMRDEKFSDQVAVAASQYAKEENFWLDKLSPVTVKSNLPYDYIKKKGERVLHTVETRFSNELHSRLLELSRGSDPKLHMILVAATCVLLNKYTGNTDIILGTPIYKQDIDVRFINTVLILRNKLSSRMTFKELLLQVRKTIEEAEENQNYPIEMLLRKLGIPYSIQDDFPLFDIVVLIENIQHKRYIQHVNPHIIFSFSKESRHTELHLEYNSLLYKTETIKRIISHITILLQKVLFNVDLELSAISILSRHEKREILYQFNHTGKKYPKDKIIQELLEDQVMKTPGETALVFENTRLSYKEMNEKVNQLARGLKKRGVLPGTIVGIMIDRSIEMIIGILAILKAGGAYLPISPDNPGNRIISILKDSQAPVLLTKTGIVENLPFTGLQELQSTGVNIFLTNPRPQITDFDGLPFPDRSLVDYEKYNHFIGLMMVKNSMSLQSSRGCPFNCSYCHKIWPKTHITRSAEKVFNEVQQYYRLGVRRFSFVDDVFNLNEKKSRRFLELIIENRLNLQLFFGLRGDILTKDYIDLMVKAGTVRMALALETASPRLQQFIQKKLNIEKLRENLEYICEKYPHVILELNTMLGFPTETKEEAELTLNFIKSLKWLHFPYINILKIYPNTDMEKLALEKGISPKSIANSDDLAYHELPDTLPFDKNFTIQYQTKFLEEYFLSKERLLHVIPHQMNVLTEDEMVQKYDSYLPVDIESFDDLLNFTGITGEELGVESFLSEESVYLPNLNKKLRACFPAKEPSKEDLKILLLDLSQFFRHEGGMLYDLVEPPIGLMYIMTYLNQRFGNKIKGKIAKSRVDFENFEELKTLLDKFKPDVIGIRTLTFYKNFFHKTISIIRHWGIHVPIIAGGPYATSDYKTILQDPNVDLVVLGEGEVTFRELIEKIMQNNKKLPADEVLKEIPGLAFVENREELKKDFAREIIMLDRWNSNKESTYNLQHINQPGDLSYIIYTSGSTGSPKGVMIEHRNVINVVRWFANQYGIEPGTRVLQISDITFDASVNQIFATLLHGGSLYVIGTELLRHLENLRQYIKENGIHIINFVPILLKELLSMGPKLGSIKYVLAGGERLDDDIKDQMMERGYTIYNHYGPTETTIDALAAKCTPGKVVLGKPISNTRCYILEDNNNLAPVGVIGEICVGGDGLARGYLNDSDTTKEKFMSDPFLPGKKIYKTGDLARWLSDGDIEFLGRRDHQVKIRGFRIELGEIENKLLKYDGIKDAIVVSTKDIKGNTTFSEKSDNGYLCAYIVSLKELEIDPLMEYLARELPGYMIPSYITRIERMPLTPTGKIDRKSLPAPVIARDRENYTAPGNELEESLVEMWGQILGLEKETIGIDANFFALGGHSIKAIILQSRIKKQLNVKMHLGEIFSLPTIRKMARHIKGLTKNIFTPIEPVELKEYYPLSSAQKQLYILQQMDPDSKSCIISQVMILEGELDRERLRETFTKLIAKHESLRSSFEMVDDQLVQKIHRDVVFEIEYYDLYRTQAEVKVKVEEERSSEGTRGLAPLSIPAAGNANTQLAKGIINDFIRPFNLTHVPLLRVGVVKIKKQKHILMVDMHHIISDGTSHTVLIENFIRLYMGKKLPALRIQYKEYSQWQNNEKENDSMKKQKEYWLGELSGHPPVLNLPIDFVRPSVQSFAGSSHLFQLGVRETTALNEIALKHGATLFMVILAIYSIWLSKLSGQEDLIVGMPTAGRNHIHLEQIIGVFLNALALRNYPEGQKTFKKFLTEVKERTLKAFENQDYPFEDLVADLGAERNGVHHPLYDVMLVFQNFRSGTDPLSRENDFQLKVKPYPRHDRKVSTNDMALYVAERTGTLSFLLQYCTKLFKKKTIERFTGYFHTLAASIINDPHKKIREIDIISREEKEQIIFEFNNTKKHIERETCYPGLFEQQTAKTPDNIAGVYKNQFLTYRELDKKSDQLANYFYFEKNLQPNDRVAVWMNRSIDFLVAVIGIMKAGGAYIPIDLVVPEKRIKQVIDDSGIGIVISQGEYTRSLNRLQWECKSFHTFLIIDGEVDKPLTEAEQEDLKIAEELWNFVAEGGTDEISEGGWISSYTGEPFTKEEMDEYGDNSLKKLTPFLHKNMRVLEIGCASGITMSRVAPRVGFYLGTDLSRVTIQKARQRLEEGENNNISLQCLPAHDIDKLYEKNFDLILMNSVIQSFHGHTYLRRVLGKSIPLLKDKGYIFIGDVMDQDVKGDLEQEMIRFQQDNKGKNYKTKVDWSEELFVSRKFFHDLTLDIPEIEKVEFSDKIHTIENELTNFRYDVFLSIDKTKRKITKRKRKYKYQDGLSSLNRFGSKKITPKSKPDDLAYVIYTSGTTGLPKGVLIHQLGMINHLYAKIHDLSLSCNDIMGQTAPPVFDISVWQFLAPLLVGARAVIIDKEVVLDPGEFLKTLQNGKITILESVPSLMKTFLDIIGQEKNKELKHLRWMITTGEALPVSLVKEWYTHYPLIKLVNAYGPTEASDDVTHYVVRASLAKNRLSVPIGKPLQNLHIYILDKNLALCPIGVRGEICIAGIGVGKGYWKDPDKTAAAFIKNPFIDEFMDDDYKTLYRTGDIGFFREDGTVECLGRLDSQVKIRGNRIELAEIESVLEKQKDIKEAVVVLLEKENEQGKLCAYLVAPGKTLETSGLRNYLTQQLPDYMIPSFFKQVDKIPLTPNGKIDKKALPDPEPGQEGDTYTPPRNQVEKKLAALWSEVLFGGTPGQNQVSIDDNFFELGGHSLIATVLVSKIYKELNVKVPLAEIFKTQTIRGLSQYIRGRELEQYKSILPAAKKRCYSLSSSQKRFYILQGMTPGNTAYNISKMVLIEGEIDKEKLENTFKNLIKRHESLRTDFELMENEPVQKIHQDVDFEIEYHDTAHQHQEEIIYNFIRPFDLSRAPLIRVGIISMEKRKNLLVVDMHHIISDGLSLRILVKDFLCFYRGDQLPTLTLQYKDYSEWQTSEKVNTVFMRQEEYWLREFKEEPPVLDIPTDYPRPMVQGMEGNRLFADIKAEETQALRKIAAAEGVTLFILMLAVYNIFLAKISGQEVIVVGTPVSGRWHPDLEQIIGVFINTLALKNYPEGEKNFEAFLTEVKKRTFTAFENQDYPFEELVDKVTSNRDVSRNPLFDTMFTFQKNQSQKIGQAEASPLKTREYEPEVTTSKFDITVSVVDAGENLVLSIAYSTNLFKKETIYRFVEYINDIISAIIRDNQVKLKDIQLAHHLFDQRLENPEIGFKF